MSVVGCGCQKTPATNAKTGNRCDFAGTKWAVRVADLHTYAASTAGHQHNLSVTDTGIPRSGPGGNPFSA
eukprot:1149665-Pelagomonas_calceolata.AAC.7